MYNIVKRKTGEIIAWEYQIEDAIRIAKKNKGTVIRDRETGRHVWGDK